MASEGQAIKLRNLRASLAQDKKWLEEMDRTGAKRDLIGRDRDKLLLDIKQQEGRIRIAEL